MHLRSILAILSVVSFYAFSSSNSSSNGNGAEVLPEKTQLTPKTLQAEYAAKGAVVNRIPEKTTSELDTSDPHRHPKVALVLAGGGAKGAAHIGVLKALEEMQVPVHIITGTSMGSYFGGLYSTGMNADEVESFIYSVDWNTGYRDRVDRSERRVRDKEYEDRYQIALELGLSLDGIRSRKGVVQGQNMQAILRETSGNLGLFQSFDDLAIQYRSVATDIVKLEPVVLDKGYLVDAMMASMSVPGVLPPYELDGRLLVDGGVTNNMPVDVAREMGADVVIAVDISTNYKSKEEFTDLFIVADQLSNYLVRRSTQEQAGSLTDNDFYIKPNVGGMETTEFDKMPYAFKEGYDTAYQLKDELAHLALNGADYQRYIDAKQEARSSLEYGDETTIDSIRIVNNSHYNDELLLSRLGLETGKALSTKEIEAGVRNLYALDRFELITYHYEEGIQGEELVVKVDEKSWGPNYANFRFFLEDNFQEGSQYALGVSTNFTGLNRNGAELRTNLELGTDKLIEAQLYKPLSADGHVFAELGVSYKNEERDIPASGFDDIGLDAVDNSIAADYKSLTSELSFGYQDTLWQEFRVGVRYTDGENDLRYNNVDSFEYERLGVFAAYTIDNLDSYSLPTKGNYLNLEYLISHDTGEHEPNTVVDSTYDDDTNYEIDARFISAFSFSRHTLVANLNFNFFESENSAFPVEPITLGGFLNLSGIPRNSLIGQNKFFSSLVYRYKWFDNDFGLFSSPFYIGSSIEYGGVWSDSDLKVKDVPMFAAGSVFAGIDSPVGPVILSYGRTEQDYDSVYLIIGTSFK